MPTEAEHGTSEAQAASAHQSAESKLEGPPIDPAEERAELERVLRHPEISRSPSLVRFLTYVCKKYFDGESQEIREQSIAVEALGRKAANFDSHVDPIVRVTARALRKKLHEIYKDADAGQRVCIRLPLGHYIPEFVRPQELEAEGGSQPNAAENGELAAGADGEAALEGERAEAGGWLGLGRRTAAAVKIGLAACGVALIFFAGFWLGGRANQPKHPEVRSLQWGEAVWSDEFDGNAPAPNEARWTYGLGPGADVESDRADLYCSPRETGRKNCDAAHPTVLLDGQGHLILRARRNADGTWSSGRISTHGLKDFQYGRIEARMKLPVGTGLWPSFWLEGSNLATAGWPASGSIDIAENVSLLRNSNGLGPNLIRSTLHGPRYFGANGLWHDFKLPNGARVDDATFHTYGIIWSPGMIQFYVDDPANIYFVQDADSIPEGGVWAFDHPFFLVLNLGVGGSWPGSPDATTPNPSDLVVDYIRAYKIPPIAAPGIEWRPISVKSGSSAPSSIVLRAPEYTGRVHLTCSAEPATVACQLATTVVNLSDTLTQEDTLTLATDTFTDKGRTLAAPGRYKLTVTATTMSGNRSQITVPFEVTRAD